MDENFEWKIAWTIVCEEINASWYWNGKNENKSLFILHSLLMQLPQDIDIERIDSAIKSWIWNDWISQRMWFCYFYHLYWVWCLFVEATSLCYWNTFRLCYGNNKPQTQLIKQIVLSTESRKITESWKYRINCARGLMIIILRIRVYFRFVWYWKPHFCYLSILMLKKSTDTLALHIRHTTQNDVMQKKKAILRMNRKISA